MALCIVAVGSEEKPGAQSVLPTQIELPLSIPLPYIKARASAELELDEHGEGLLTADGCSSLELADLSVSEADQGLELSMRVRANPGARIFGQCRSPGALSGRAILLFEPRAAQSGDAIVFDAKNAEFRDASGETSLLTTPSRMLAESLLLPRLQDLHVDVGQNLRDIDALLVRFFSDSAASAIPPEFRARVSHVAMLPNAMESTLLVQLPPPRTGSEQGDSVGTSRESVLTESERERLKGIEEELDGFLTTVVSGLAEQLETRQQELLLSGMLIDARQRITQILTEDSASELDPLRSLFMDSWDTLAAVSAQLPPSDTGEESGLRLATFLAAGDALRAIDALEGYGVELSSNGLRRLARLLLAGETPAAFTPLPTSTKPELQRLFGFSSIDIDPIPALRWHQHLSPIQSVFADDLNPAQQLREVFPNRGNLDVYLAIVSQVIDNNLEAHWEESRLDESQRELFVPLVRATAWKETCWRHYIDAGDEVTVIRSAVGAIGMMQIVGRVWRSLFDLERLESEVNYNVSAGIQILEHYLLDYAVRRGEDKQKGGRDNLVRATYAAYNGGPSRLTRYRRSDVSSRARAVDAQFYNHYMVMREQAWPEKSACYAR